MSRLTSLRQKNCISSRKPGYLDRKSETKESKILVYLTCLYIVVWYLQLGTRIDILGAVRFEFLLGAFLSATAIIKLLNQQEKASPLKGSIVFYYSVLIVYTAFSYDHATSWDVFFNRVFKFSMIAMFFAAFIQSTWALKLAVAAFLLAMLKIGQEGFVGWYGGGLVWENQGVMRLHGSTPLIRHPNSFSGMAVGCLPFIYFLYPVAGQIWKKILLLVLLILCALIIVFTASRTGYVATSLLLLYAILKLEKANRKKIVVIALIVFPLSLPFVPEQYIDRFESIFTMQEAEGQSAATRLEIISDAISIAATKPWGIGVGAFPKVRQETFGRFQDTHNLYLELLTNLSLIGLLAFLYLISRIIKLNIRIQKTLQEDNRNEPEFVKALTKATVGFVIARLFLGLFGMDAYEIYWWFAIGLTISCYRSTIGLGYSSHQIASAGTEQ